MYEISTSTVESAERKIKKYTRKWLGLPAELMDVALYYKKSKLCLPLKSVVEEFKAGKARLAMMLSRVHQHGCTQSPTNTKDWKKMKST